MNVSRAAAGACMAAQQALQVPAARTAAAAAASTSCAAKMQASARLAVPWAFGGRSVTSRAARVLATASKAAGRVRNVARAGGASRVSSAVRAATRVSSTLATAHARKTACLQGRGLQRRGLQRRGLQRRGLQRRGLQRRGLQRRGLQRRVWGQSVRVERVRVGWCACMDAQQASMGVTVAASVARVSGGPVSVRMDSARTDAWPDTPAPSVPTQPDQKMVRKFLLPLSTVTRLLLGIIIMCGQSIP
jgi:hypothetical protein